ncbi:histidine kinase [Neobacillus niacini]|uniref:sensor histidine kinase n=1 Tax=Neobacillus niacini TaxID=86668 RepID=UPI002FFF073E
MSYRTLKFFSIFIPTVLIGGFEFFRHSVLLHNLSMTAGNFWITFLTLIISYIFSTWMFRAIDLKNQRITKEREMRAIYEERERLAKELHDSIAQTLFLLKVQLKKGKPDEAGALVNSVDSHLRQAIFNLRISPDEHISFSKRIKYWLDDWSTVSGIDLHTDITSKESYFTPAEVVQLVGIIQEAFTNIRKHAEASSVNFTLQTSDSHWEMVIEDNGKGFRLTELPANKYGISMLKERADRIKADLEITSEELVGTKIWLKGDK